MSKQFYIPRENMDHLINRWDLMLLIIVFSLLFFFAWTGVQMATPYQLGDPINVSLKIVNLPSYAMRTVLRMFIALALSLIFTLVVGTLAAKNKSAERLIIPTIDILQSVPVLSFLAITVTVFIHLFPGSLLGPECACIFAIFTAQVWNITLGFYQSLKTVPDNLKEVTAIFQLSAWQKFWKLEVPFSMSTLLWNMMMSMSASWFFVVVSEFITVAHQDIHLPGVGSYIALAIEQRNVGALLYAILTMAIVIFLYDQILFRPLLAWSEKFKMEFSIEEQVYQSWLIDLLRRSRLVKRFINLSEFTKNQFINGKWLKKSSLKPNFKVSNNFNIWLKHLFSLVILAYSVWFLISFISTEVTVKEVVKVFLLGSITAFRVIVLILLSSILWIPIGVWIGLRPRMAQKIQPIIQFAAAFPANLFYPLFVIAIVKFHLNVEIWLTPLMILGTQWYILFNVIAGASTIPQELYLAAENFSLKGWLWWKRLILPGIFPFYLTGAITAAGGAWNASIVAEWVSWGNTTLHATGLGEYIQANTIQGDFPKIVLATSMMCLYVLAFNHLLWRPLYRLAQERFRLE